MPPHKSRFGHHLIQTLLITLPFIALTAIPLYFATAAVPVPPWGNRAEGYPSGPYLTDVPMRSYLDGAWTGGLYGNWSNIPSVTQQGRLNAAAGVSGYNCATTLGCPGIVEDRDANGNATSTGAKVFVAMGHSRQEYEWGANEGSSEADTDEFFSAGTSSLPYLLGLDTAIGKPANTPNLDPSVYFIDCAFGGRQTEEWASDVAGYYTRCSNEMLNYSWEEGVGPGVNNTPYTWNNYYELGWQVVASGSIWQVTNTGGSAPCLAGSTTPNWSGSMGSTVTDNQCTWTNEGPYTGTPVQLATKQIQVAWEGQALVVNGPESGYTGTVTISGGTTMTTSGTFPLTGSVQSEGWFNIPITLDGVQNVISMCTTNQHCTLENTATNGSHTLVLANYEPGLASCGPKPWTGYTPCEPALQEYLMGEVIRQSKVSFPNLEISFNSSDLGSDYCEGIVRTGCLRWGSEDWDSALTVQDLVTAQTSQDDSLVTLTGCTVSGTTVTCTTAGLPSQYVNGVNVQVAGTTGTGFNTSCTVQACPGVPATISGSSFSYTDASASGTATGGHVSIVADQNIGSLESQDGTAPLVAWGPYEWGTSVARSDGYQLYCEDYYSSGSNAGDTATHEAPYNFGTTAQTLCTGIHGSGGNLPHTHGGGYYLAQQQLEFWTGCSGQAFCPAQYAWLPGTITTQMVCKNGGPC